MPRLVHVVVMACVVLLASSVDDDDFMSLLQTKARMIKAPAQKAPCNPGHERNMKAFLQKAQAVYGLTAEHLAKSALGDVSSITRRIDAGVQSLLANSSTAHDSLMAALMDIYVLREIVKRPTLSEGAEADLRQQLASGQKITRQKHSAHKVKISLDEWEPKRVRAELRPYFDNGKLLEPVIFQVEGLEEAIGEVPSGEEIVAKAAEDKRLHQVLTSDQISVISAETLSGTGDRTWADDYVGGRRSYDNWSANLSDYKHFAFQVKFCADCKYGISPIVDDVYDTLESALYVSGPEGGPSLVERAKPPSAYTNPILWWQRPDIEKRPYTPLHNGLDSTLGLNILLRGKKEWNVTRPNVMPELLPLYLHDYMVGAGVDLLSDVPGGPPERWHFTLSPGEVLVFDDEWFHEVFQTTSETLMTNRRTSKLATHFPQYEILKFHEAAGGCIEM